MGTTYHIKYVNDGVSLSSTEIKVAVDKLLKKVNQSMSTYIKTSEISEFNSLKSLKWVSASPEILFVTNKALEVGRLTQGSYDPTIGPLVNLWGFGPTGKRQVPSDEAIASAMEGVGLEKISLNIEKGEWKKNHSRVYVDLSSLAKGYGVDVVAKLIESYGSKDFMVEIGGEVKTRGSKLGVPWKIAIESPDRKDQTVPYQKVLELGSHALATSGDYRNFFIENKKSYSHTINFKTGKPVAHTLASVSVATDDSCMEADAWATALMSLGFKEGSELAEKLKIAAYFVYKLDSQDNFVSKGTTEFNKLFK